MCVTVAVETSRKRAQLLPVRRPLPLSDCTEWRDNHCADSEDKDRVQSARIYGIELECFGTLLWAHCQVFEFAVIQGSTTRACAADG